MNLKDVIAKLPEADRAEAEKVIQEAIVAANPVAGIDSNEKAAAFIQGNKFFKGALDSEISVKVAAHDERFTKEKLPGIVEAEIKKRNPEKDPLRIELDALKAEREAEKAELKRERLKALAIKKAADAGIPADDIDRFIDEDEDRTGAAVEAFAKRWKAYSDKAVEAALKEKLGNNGLPRGGNTPPPTGKMAEMQKAYSDLMGQKRFQEALKVQAEMQALGEKNG